MDNIETTVTFQVLPDDSPDTSYLEQDEFKDELAAYQRGEFGFVGVRAKVEVWNTTRGTRTIITSAGLWGIESNSDRTYLLSVGNDELTELREELTARNIDINGIDPVLA